MINKHVGLFIKEFYMIPNNITSNQLALILDVNAGTVSRLLTGKAACSVEMAFRLSKVFDQTPEYWLTLQMAYDLSTCEVDLSKVKVLR